MEERFEGYVVDLHCLRSWPHAELRGRAKNHSTSCALRGEHIESGYGLVDDAVLPLDAKATPMILHALREADQETGVRLRVTRRENRNVMETALVDVAITREEVQSSNIKSVGYHDRTLEVEFKNGIYQFLDVPEEVYEELINADSHGRYFNYKVKAKYQSRKIA